MKNRILGMGLGLIVAVVILMLSEKMIHHYFNVPHTLFEPEGQDVKEISSSTNTNTQLLVLMLAHAVASFFGGMIVARFLPTEWKKFCIRFGWILTFFNVLNLIMLPHPIWFVIASNLVYIPFAYLGGKMMQR